MTFVESIGGFIIAILILVSIHEWAHFAMARWLGIKVLKFSIGFGKPFFTRHIGPHNMEFSLAPIPLGGYVKMLDSREQAVCDDDLTYCFDKRHPWQRIAVVLAGPVSNLILAALLLTTVNLAEKQNLKVLVGQVTADSPAVVLQPQDEITHINNKPVASWREAQTALSAAVIHRSKLTITFQRDQNINSFDIPVSWAGTDPATFNWDKLGITPFSPPLKPILSSVLPDSAASDADLMAGDTVQTFNGLTVNSWQHLVELVQAKPDAIVQLDIVRQGTVTQKSVKLHSKIRDEHLIGFLGAQVDLSASDISPYINIEKQDLFTALRNGVLRTVDLSYLILVSIYRMITGDISLDNISGPVTIAQVAGETVHHSLLSFVHFLAFLSISLGVLNLLPIPMLDGGHLLYYIIEWVRKKPISDRTQINFQKLGFLALMMLMALAFFNDFNRFIS